MPSSTGDPKLDALIVTHFTEAIAATKQVIVDRHPEIDWTPRHDNTVALICTELWPIFGALFTEGASLSVTEGILLSDDDG